VEKLVTGWIYLGSEAVELGLIDATETYRDAVDEAAGLGGITGKPVVVSGGRRPSIYDILIQYYLEGFIKNLLSVGSVPGIRY
jgi:protease IV